MKMLLIGGQGCCLWWDSPSSSSSSSRDAQGLGISPPGAAAPSPSPALASRPAPSAPLPWKGAGRMSTLGIHRGYLRKYGGFLFKQWKEKFLILSLDGSLLICPDANSPVEMEFSLAAGCEAILEGSDIRDLPRLPLGAQRDSCLGLSLRDGKSLLLLASNSQECRQWLNILRKVKESFSQGSPSGCKVHINSPVKKDHRKGGEGGGGGGGSPNHTEIQEAACSPHCLRHGFPTSAGVRAACILMGGAAAGPTMGYMVTSATAGHPVEPHPPDFKELGYHPSVCDSESQYEVLDYPGLDQDFDMLDFGGFTF